MSLPPPIHVEPIITMKPRASWETLMRCRVCRELRNIRLQSVEPVSEETFICAGCVGNWASRTGATPGVSRRDRLNLLKIKALSETLRWSSINGPLPR